MTEANGTVRWAPTVPPNVVPAPPEEKPPESGNYNSGFLADLFCWWRSGRERRLIERIRKLESENALLTEENLSMGLMVERLNRHVQAQTMLSVRMADGLDGTRGSAAKETTLTKPKAEVVTDKDEDEILISKIECATEIITTALDKDSWSASKEDMEGLIEAASKFLIRQFEVQE